MAYSMIGTDWPCKRCLVVHKGMLVVGVSHAENTTQARQEGTRRHMYCTVALQYTVFRE